MENKNYLGIYLSKTGATVVCLDSLGKGRRILGAFDVSLEPQQDADSGAAMSELARLIAAGCAERQLTFAEAYVAVDRAMFMQHKLHSDFTDTRQINQTIKFDTEGTLSADINSVAVAYKIASTDQGGSQLAVFTAEHQILSEILTALQGNGIDPVAVEPDVICLSRFTEQHLRPAEDSNSLFAMLSGRSAYLVGFAESRQSPGMRAFLVGPTQDRAKLLAREVPLTIALFGAGEPVTQLRVLDSTGALNCRQLSERLGMEVAEVELSDWVVADSELLAGCADLVDFAVACGGALAPLEKTRSINFRNDYMPYQGKKRRLEKTVKFLSVSACVLIVALGVYVTAQLLQVNRYGTNVYNKLKPQYSAVALGQRMPSRMKDAVKKLGAISRLVQHNIGQGGDEEAIARRLTLVLEAFNKCAKRTDLNIDNITVTDKNISIRGDTSDQRNTLKVFDTIKEKMDIPQHRFQQEGPRHSFNITVVPKNSDRKSTGTGGRRT